MKIKQTNENIFGAARKFSDAFFDGLKSNAINKALKQAETNPKIPSPIINKMKAIDKLAKELEDDLKYYS